MIPDTCRPAQDIDTETLEHAYICVKVLHVIVLEFSVHFYSTRHNHDFILSRNRTVMISFTDRM